MAEINILSTRPLNDELIRDAALKGIQLEVMSFIETRPSVTASVREQIRLITQQHLPVVFTSMNAVDAVAEAIQGITPNWKVYCIGNTTRGKVEDNWGSAVVAGSANDAIHLAMGMATALKNQEVVFFCGDQRRPELPDYLTQQGIKVREIVVYETIARPQSVGKAYDAILFFSPSAVQSFFWNNRILPGTLCFAIGATTAAAIRTYGNYSVITAQQPGKDLLVRQAVDYFSSGKNQLTFKL